MLVTAGANSWVAACRESEFPAAFTEWTAYVAPGEIVLFKTTAVLIYTDPPLAIAAHFHATTSITTSLSTFGKPRNHITHKITKLMSTNERQ